MARCGYRKFPGNLDAGGIPITADFPGIIPVWKYRVGRDGLMSFNFIFIKIAGTDNIYIIISKKQM